MSFECPELAGVRVLVVDDDEDSREMLATLLAHSGAVVTMAATASEAFSAFERESPRVLLSDIGLPVEDGFSLLRRVRSFEKDAAVRAIAIALSGYGSEKDRKRAREEGFDGHFTKPIPLPELLRKLGELLRGA